MTTKHTVVALVAVAITALLFATSPASATMRAACGNYCDGKSPNARFWDDTSHVYYRCSDDAWTVRKKSATNHPTIELRYSSKCQTAWARINNTSFAWKVDSFYANGSLRKTYKADLGTTYTRMVNDTVGLEARACVYVPYGGWSCTSKF
jgi:uncharacterized protein DUF2690